MTTQYVPAAGNGHAPNAAAPPAGSPTWPPQPAMRERLPKVRAPRRPALAAGGAILVLLCGVASAALATSGDHRVKVLALAREVQAGQVLTVDDLRVAEISGSGVQALDATGAGSVVGETVTASLPAGTLLNPSMLTATPLPGAGLQLVAVAVKPGGVPQQAVPGRDVSLVRVVTAADGRAGAVPAVLVAKARLVSVGTDTASGVQVLSVQVPESAVVAVAQASAAGAIAVTLLPVTP
jgi:hypothetical protein